MPAPTLQQFALAVLDPDTEQVRSHIDAPTLAGLEQSIRAQGVLVPIIVEPAGQRFRIVDGHRRVEAARRAELATIPEIVRDRPLSRAEAIQVQLVTACQRESLSRVDQAFALHELAERTRWSSKQIAEQIGKSEASVSKLLTVCAAPESVVSLLRDGGVSLTTAYAVARITDPVKQAEAAELAARGELTRDAAESLLRPKAAKPRSKERGRSQLVKVCIDNVRVSLPGSMTAGAFVSWLGESLSRACALDAERLGIAEFLSALKTRSTAKPVAPEGASC